MGNEGRFARILGGVSAVGLDRLRELAARTNAKVAPDDDARSLAAKLLTRLERPDDLRYHGLTDAEVEMIGTALGLGARATWRPNVSAEEFARLPFYAKPSYDFAVWDALGASPWAPEPAARHAAAKPRASVKAKAKPSPKARSKVRTKPARAKPSARAKAPTRARTKASSHGSTRP